MNCDRVFDVLTRGPFPTGAASDAAVERHLGCCVECRRLATALRPAVELFEEAIRPEESHGLPSYWGEVTEPHSAAYDATFATLEEEIAVARSTRRTLQRATTTRGIIPQRAAEDCDRLLRFLGAVAVGVVLAFTFRTMVDQPGGGRIGLAGRNTMSASILPWQVCSSAMITPQRAGNGPSMQAEGISTVAALDAAHQRCCSECHHAGSQTSNHGRMSASVARSCVACHEHDVEEPDEQEYLLDAHPRIEKSTEPGV
jgi:hypothetical protein